MLLRPNVALFYIGSTPSKFGGNFRTVFSSHVMALRRDSEEFEYAMSRNRWKLLDTRNNSLLCFENGVFKVATKVVTRGITFKHSLMVSFVGGYQWDDKIDEIGDACHDKRHVERAAGDEISRDAKHEKRERTPSDEISGAVQHEKEQKTASGDNGEEITEAANGDSYAVTPAPAKSPPVTRVIKSPIPKGKDKGRTRVLKSPPSKSKDKGRTCVPKTPISERKNTGCQLSTYEYELDVIETSHGCQCSAHDNDTPYDVAASPQNGDHDTPAPGGKSGVVAATPQDGTPTSCLFEVIDGHKYDYVRQKLCCPCADCNRKFASVDAFRTHYIVQHLHEKPEACHECGKRFANDARLQKHISVMHKKDRLIQCKLCDATFAWSSSLKIHMTDFHLPKKFQCKRCDKRFARKTELKEHTSVVHLGKPRFPCEFCDSSFTMGHNLKRHVKIKHTSSS